jgi:hypothetical protein
VSVCYKEKSGVQEPFATISVVAWNREAHIQYNIISADFTDVQCEVVINIRDVTPCQNLIGWALETVVHCRFVG